MNLLLDPNLAYLLLLTGSLLGLLALVTPGTGVLEMAALFCLVLAGYAVTQLQFNLWALVVMGLSVIPFLYAIQKPKRELFLAISILVMVVGSVYLFKNESGRPAVNIFVAGAGSLVYAGFLWIAIRKTLQVLHAIPVQNLEGLVGQTGNSKTSVHESGSVQVAGELWSARSLKPISAGSPVRVVRREGFTLVVEKESLTKSN